MSNNNEMYVDMPASVNPTGKTKTERQLSVAAHATSQATQALMDMGGKVGKLVRSGVVRDGLMKIAEQASTGNYKPAAEYFSVKLGAPFVISSRASFDSLPDVFSALVLKALGAKNGGYVTRKNGDVVPSAPHKLALELRDVANFLIEAKEQFYKARLEAQASKKEQAPARKTTKAEARAN